MRLRHIKGSEDFISSSRDSIDAELAKSYKGSWSKLFGNEHAIYIEIGMGKGKFIRDMARAYPDINFIGIERYPSVLMKAIQRKNREEEVGEPCNNLYFLCLDALELAEVFDEGEVDRIYLNFSDPWPKKRHSSRRLSSERFLPVYDKILAKDGQIELKTDNLSLFEYSLESIVENSWQLRYKSYDLHSEAVENIMSEYEEKFSSKGQKIYKLIAFR